jgi:hypothetical protein
MYTMVSSPRIGGKDLAPSKIETTQSTWATGRREKNMSNSRNKLMNSRRRIRRKNRYRILTKIRMATTNTCDFNKFSSESFKTKE